MAAVSRSSKDVLRSVLGRLQLCPATTAWLHVDDSRADWPNPEQDTPPENFEFLNSQLERCLEKLIKFFSRKQHLRGQQSDSSDSLCNDSQQPALEILLHPPVYTCAQAENLCQKPLISGTLAMKNLFLKDKKKRFYLVSACVDTEIKLKEVKFAKQVSFASQEALREKLGLLPGSVTPFGLLNDGSPPQDDIKVEEGVSIAATPNGDATGSNGKTAAEGCERGSQVEQNSSGEAQSGKASELFEQFKQEVEFHLDPRVATALDTTFVDFHPNACNATVCMKSRDFVEFIEQETGHKVNTLDLE
eukprot:TRINITY_DN74003_c0_g1_i1.p1 TRINITY_DN74003_c0_g1~~TRINITY_DN74003_c0_g1_i1.p1  ORF type:complete len:341 (+),score=61.12 TRINITY_DN74003_c0_g1_i1:114-1025(+)